MFGLPSAPTPMPQCAHDGADSCGNEQRDELSISKKKADAIEHHWCLIASAYSLTSLAAGDRVTLYLVVRELQLLTEVIVELPLTPSIGDPIGKARRLPNYRPKRMIFLLMKTQGEIESAISDGMTRFEQEYMGRGPKDVRAHLIDDLIVVRLKGVLTAAEQHLVQTLQPEKGRDLLKEVRSHLIEIARPTMEAMVKGITGVDVVSLHHDISTVTGEEVVLFTLAESPPFRETKKR